MSNRTSGPRGVSGSAALRVYVISTVLRNRRRPFSTRLLLGVPAVASLLLVAAFPAEADDGPGVVRHQAAVSAANALIAEVRVSLDRAARVFVEYDNPQAGRYRTALSEPGAKHVIPVVRLRPETTYDYTIFVADESGQDESEPQGGGRFTTGWLPPPLAAVPVRVSGRSSQPLILADYRRRHQFTYFVVHDETGGVVWYNLEPQTHHMAPVDRLPGGNLIFLDGGRLTEMTPLGEVVNRFERGGQWGAPHHDVTVLDDGRVIYPSQEVIFLDDSANGGPEEFKVDHLRVWDPQSGRVERVWDSTEAWDVRDPNQRVPTPGGNPRVDWTHLNSVTVGPRGNFILSFRTRHQVISLSPDFRTIEWQLGGPGSDYEFPDPADRFYGQHTASQLANGNVLVFDNGWLRPDAEGGQYSRALELRLDDQAGTAVKVWEYRPDPDIFSLGSGSAYRLRNGSTLVNFPRRERLTDALLVTEVDAAGNEVFRLEHLPRHEPPLPPLKSYRAYGITSIMGETMLRPPAAAPAPTDAEIIADGFTVQRRPQRPERGVHGR